MIRVHIETPMHEDYNDHPKGIKYNFSENNNWLGIWDQEEQLIATYASSHVVYVEVIEDDSQVEVDIQDESTSSESD